MIFRAKSELSLSEEAQENLSEAVVKEPEPVEKRRKLGLDWDESDDEEEVKEDVVKREMASYRAEPEVSREEDILKW